MDDLIRRSDAIEAIEEVDWYHQNRNKDMVSGANSDEHQAWYKADDVYKALEAVPSADRPQGWIPCSERLPEEKESVYLICTDYGYLCSCRWTQDIYGLGAANEWSTWGWNHADVPQFSKVVAWMDLKPWKGADDEALHRDSAE